MKNYRDHFYRSADDRLDLYARDYDGNKDGTPILMMHGLTRNSADFEAIAEILSLDHRLIIPDQRGRGRSEYDTEPANYSPIVYVQDMFALLRSLEIESVIMLGTSMGGLIALLMATSQPKIAKALILNDVGPEVDPAGIARLRGYVGKSIAVTNWQEAAEHCRQTGEVALPDYNYDDWLTFARRTFVADENGTPKLAYDMAISKGIEGDEPSATPANLWPVWKMLSEIPILAIRGETSDILSRATLAKMGEQHKGTFESEEVPGRGHAPMLDEWVAVSAIKTFLDSIAA